jgi:hypothetical protein
MFFKIRKPITDAEKLDAILEYLNNEMTRWRLSASPAASQSHTDKVNARIMYLEEQIALTSARRALENINPNAK